MMTLQNGLKTTRERYNVKTVTYANKTFPYVAPGSKGHGRAFNAAGSFATDFHAIFIVFLENCLKIA